MAVRFEYQGRRGDDQPAIFRYEADRKNLEAFRDMVQGALDNGYFNGNMTNLDGEVTMLYRILRVDE